MRTSVSCVHCRLMFSCQVLLSGFRRSQRCAAFVSVFINHPLSDSRSTRYTLHNDKRPDYAGGNRDRSIAPLRCSQPRNQRREPSKQPRPLTRNRVFGRHMVCQHLIVTALCWLNRSDLVLSFRLSPFWFSPFRPLPFQLLPFRPSPSNAASSSLTLALRSIIFEP